MGVILGFHSFTSRDLPAGGDAHVPVTRFTRLVRLARRLGDLVPLGVIVRRHREGRSTKGLIAITMDDAYAALGGQIAAFIEAEQVPVTVFVVAEASRGGEPFWWDRVDDAAARVTADTWRRFEDACGVPEAYRRSQPVEHGPVRPLRQWILAQYAGHWPPHLEPALAELTARAGCRTTHRPMTYDELGALAAISTVEFGVHTLSHPVLPLLSDDEIRREVGACHEELRARLPRVMPVLAFPFALFTRRSIEAARAAGMTACLTLSGDRVSPRDDAGALPRICVTRQDPAWRLAAQMMGLPAAIRAWTGRERPVFPELPSAAT